MLLKNGSTGMQVKHLQQALRMMCCSPGTVDSIYGAGTQAAVQKFQEEWGLDVDGIVGDDTWSCLVKEIKPIQTALKQKGFYSGTISGVATDSTYNAVINYQKSRGLSADGMVGAATRAFLFDTDEDGSMESLLPLTTGARGDYILNLQYALRILCCSPGNADGIFGANTAAAVKKYQNKYGFSETGVVNQATWDHLSDQIEDIQRRVTCSLHLPKNHSLDDFSVEVGASRSTTLTRRVSTSYPRASHGSF